MKVVAIIPARGGSKGVPEKNKLVVDGKPLISYSIEAALESKKLEEIWVSSDDSEILNIASSYSGVQLHKRDPGLATDTSPISETVSNILRSITCDAIMLLQPSSPLRNEEDIDKSIGLLENNDSINSVISVISLTDMHPAQMYWEKNGALKSVMPEYENFRRQDIPPVYFRNGCIYLIRKKAFETHQSFKVQPIAPYLMSADWLLNIDEPRDMLIAKTLIPAWKKGEL